MSDKSVDIEYIADETADQLLERSLRQHFAQRYTENVKEAYQVAVNGNIIDRELLSFTKISENDTVGIHPRLKGGSEDVNSFLRTALVITAVVAAGPLAATWFTAGSIGAGLFVAGVSFVASMAANSLFPPPEIKDPGLGKSAERSQMYSISGQSNTVKQFQIVPKVYGTHRIFPNIAATPYTQIEADDRGNIVQYYYAIYDFGLGPVLVDDIRIGDTSIDFYAGDDRNVNYRKVDLNKPVNSEGVWDDDLFDSFYFYKGDVETEAVNYSLPKDRLPGGSGISLSEYQVTRNCSNAVDGSNQEIIMDFVFPNGLVAYNSKSEPINRSVTFSIQFSKANENVWKSIQDLDYVDGAPTLAGLTPITTPPTFVRGGIYYKQTIGGPELPPIPYPLVRRYAGKTGGILSPAIITYSIVYKAGTDIINLQSSPVGSQTILQPSIGDLVFDNTTNLFLGTIVELGPEVSVNNNSPIQSPYFFSDYKVRQAKLSSSLPKDVITGTVKVEINSNGEETITDVTTNPNLFRTRSASGSMFTATNRKAGQIYMTIAFKPKEVAAYKVRVVREQSYSTSSFLVQDELVFYKLTTRFDRQPIVTNKRHVFLEVKIKATNQLNGNIQNLNAKCSSVLDVYDPETQTWVKQETSNPAWVFADIITGEVNKKPLSK
jgi:predicted phage tail protein